MICKIHIYIHTIIYYITSLDIPLVTWQTLLTDQALNMQCRWHRPQTCLVYISVRTPSSQDVIIVQCS